jgi:hypothetical protein
LPYLFTCHVLLVQGEASLGVPGRELRLTLSARFKENGSVPAPALDSPLGFINESGFAKD